MFKKGVVEGLSGSACCLSESGMEWRWWWRVKSVSKSREKRRGSEYTLSARAAFVSAINTLISTPKRTHGLIPGLREDTDRGWSAGTNLRNHRLQRKSSRFAKLDLAYTENCSDGEAAHRLSQKVPCLLRSAIRLLLVPKLKSILLLAK